MADTLTFDKTQRRRKPAAKKTVAAPVDAEDDASSAAAAPAQDSPLPQIENLSISSSSSAAAASSSSQDIDEEDDYSYEKLVDRIFDIMENNDPDMLNQGDQRVRCPPPSVYREGTRKTVWANFADAADAIGRQKEHLQAYALAELGTTGTLDAENRLTIRGRFQPKQIQNVVRHYISEYVICQTCKKPDTTLRKENRLFFLACSKCGSRRSVATIKQGFVAQVGRRKRN